MEWRRNSDGRKMESMRILVGKSLGRESTGRQRRRRQMDGTDSGAAFLISGVKPSGSNIRDFVTYIQVGE